MSELQSFLSTCTSFLLSKGSKKKTVVRLVSRVFFFPRPRENYIDQLEYHVMMSHELESNAIQQ